MGFLRERLTTPKPEPAEKKSATQTPSNPTVIAANWSTQVSLVACIKPAKTPAPTIQKVCRVR